jgi:hypothetical protein
MLEKLHKPKLHEYPIEILIAVNIEEGVDCLAPPLLQLDFRDLGEQ